MKKPTEARNVLNLDPKRFHPLHDQVLLEMEIEKQRGSILIPETSQQNVALLVGVVLEAGPEVKRAKVGDRVLVNHKDIRVSKIDTLLWLAPDATLFCKVDPKVESVIQSVS